MTNRHSLYALAALGITVAACEERQAQAPRNQVQQQIIPSDERETLARAVVEDRLRARHRLTSDSRQRGVHVWPQAIQTNVAVCGQLNASGRAGEPFIPYVAVVTFNGERATVSEFVIGASAPEAARVYVEMLERCHAGGGPATNRAQARVMPPAPVEMPTTSQQPPAPVPVAVAPSAPVPVPPPSIQGVPASGTVTTSSRTPVNIRIAPVSGSEVVRSAPRASVLQVFATAPGGWMQVGEGEPWGWVHSSVLDRAGN